MQVVKDKPWEEAILQVPELDTGELPPALEFIWDWFLKLSQTRSYNMGGPNPITYTEIESFKRLFQLNITDWQIDLITDLDMVYLKVNAKK